MMRRYTNPRLPYLPYSTNKLLGQHSSVCYGHLSW